MTPGRLELVLLVLIGVFVAAALAVLLAPWFTGRRRG